MPVGDAFFVQLRGKPRGVAPCPHQRLCLWTPRRVFDPLDTHLAIELVASAYSARVFIQVTIQHCNMGGDARRSPEGDRKALWNPRKRPIPSAKSTLQPNLDVLDIPAAESRRIPLSAALPLPPGHDPAKALHKTYHYFQMRMRQNGKGASRWRRRIWK